MLWVLRRLRRVDLHVTQPRVEFFTCAHDNDLPRLMGQTSRFVLCQSCWTKANLLGTVQKYSKFVLLLTLFRSDTARPVDLLR